MPAKTFAQANKETSESDHPFLTTAENTIDYDTIIYNNSITKQLTVKNTGNAPLQIYNIRSSCGVSVPGYPRNKIKPGENGTIRVRYNARQLGPVNRKIIIHSNSPENTMIIKLNGYVIPENN